MHKLTLALAGAVALASASAAQATISVDALNTDVLVTDVYNDPFISYITYQKPVGESGSFSDTLTFLNDVAGIYNLSVLTQVAALVDFDTLTISGGTLGGPMSFDGPDLFNNAYTYALANLNLGAGTYQITLEGTAPRGTTWQGTVNFNAVPEPATWAMMLIGFGAVGFSMRRRRKVVAMPQIA